MRAVSNRRSESLAWPLGPCSKVFAQALCTRLADVELSTDRLDSTDSIFRKLLGEHFDRLTL